MWIVDERRPNIEQVTLQVRVVFTVRSSHKSSKHQRFRNLYRIGVLVIWLDCFFGVFSTSMIRPHWDNTEHHYEQAIDFHSWWEDQKLLVCDQNVEIQRLNYLHFILFDYRNLFWNTVQKNMWKIWPRWRTLYRHTQLRVHEANSRKQDPGMKTVQQRSHGNFATSLFWQQLFINTCQR